MVHLESYALNVLLLAACAIPAESALEGSPGEAPSGSDPIVVDATFSAVFIPGIPALTYDPMLVPESGKVRVTITADGTGNGKAQEVVLAVAGFQPSRPFGGHLHTNGCGPSGEDAGPPYQHTVDPAATPEHPSTDPAYANPQNEVWLDFTTDGSGVATSSAAHPWPFDPNRPPRSLIIATDKAADKAGARLACVNLPSP